MRSSGFAAGALLGASLLLGAGRAAAYNFYTGGLPNGQDEPTQCLYCHITETGGARTDFGQLFTGSMTADGVYEKWKGGVYLGDSDNDLLKNGLELGDPCGTWTQDGTPDFADTSDPNDPDSKVTTPMPECMNTPPPSMGPGMAPPLPQYEAGFCAVQGPLGDGGAPAAWAGLGALAALVLKVRRRLRRAA